MTIRLPQFLLDENDDWIESSRSYWYPRLHNTLRLFGFGSTGTTYWSQYVGAFEEDEEVVEEELVDLGCIRNPLAYYKSLPDGRESEGSWVLLHRDAPDLVAPGMQLHLTFYEREVEEAGLEVFAHYEDDWRVAPFAHLRETHFNASAGVAIATDLFDRSSFLVLKDSKRAG